MAASCQASFSPLCQRGAAVFPLPLWELRAVLTRQCLLWSPSDGLISAFSLRELCHTNNARFTGDPLQLSQSGQIAALHIILIMPDLQEVLVHISPWCVKAVALSQAPCWSYLLFSPFPLLEAPLWLPWTCWSSVSPMCVSITFHHTSFLRPPCQIVCNWASPSLLAVWEFVIKFTLNLDFMQLQ